MTETTNADRGRVEGRVAEILNAYELVINRGHRHGVLAGMKFAVLARTPLEVRDPETDEVLDAIDREKVRVEAVEVRDRMTICKTYRITKTPAGPWYMGGIALSAAHLTRPPSEKRETLSTKDKSFPPPISEEDSFVKRNDRVVEVEAD